MHDAILHGYLVSVPLYVDVLIRTKYTIGTGLTWIIRKMHEAWETCLPPWSRCSHGHPI